jgi:hypothetical protein
MDERLDQEWRTFELYEKIRVRERRKRLLISSLALILFFALCAVPVVAERSPKWKSLRAAQRLSIEIEKLKTLAIQKKKPVKITFLEKGEMRIDLLDDCKNTTGTLIEQKAWKNEGGDLKVLTPSEASQFDLKLAIDEVCFDPVFGLENIKRRVIAVVPVKDLTEHRLDRASYVILDGDSAEISIN